MFPLRKPSAAKIGQFLAVQSKLDLTCASVGATADVPPVGYVVDHTRIELGKGRKIFEAAKDALRRWQQFQLGWVEARPHDALIEVGAVVAVVARIWGVWWLNACRIVYVVDEPKRFGFGYGTLPGHAASGEERFSIEWDETDDVVRYDVYAFSQPHRLLARLGYRWVRRTQHRFGRESAAVMLRSVRRATGEKEAIR